MKKKQRYKWLLTRLRSLINESRKESKKKEKETKLGTRSGAACAPRVAAVDYILPKRIDTLFKAASTTQANVRHGFTRGADK